MTDPTPTPGAPGKRPTRTILLVAAAGLIACLVAMFWPVPKSTTLMLIEGVAAAFFASILLATWQSSALDRRRGK